jgi:primosomal replication protein N
VNRVFLSGKLQEKVDVMYTPKGEKIVKFPLWVDEGGFRIDVVFVDQQGSRDFPKMVGREVMVSGVLTGASDRPHNALRLRAHKILWMEE